MRVLALALVQRHGTVPSFSWALGAQSDDGRESWALLDGDGRPGEGEAGAELRTIIASAPPGAAVRVIEVGGREYVGVVREGDRIEAAHDVALGARIESVAPVQVREAAPGAAGAAVVAARSELRRALVDPRRAALRWWSEHYRAESLSSGLAGACWLDIALLPHQLAAVREVLRSPTVAHVLADEVGLGKTVEALMIWSALRALEPGLTTVVAAPRSVIPQWCLEIRRRAEHGVFRRRFEDLPPVLLAQGDEPLAALDRFDHRGLVLTDHDGLAALASSPTSPDLLIVDEAHDLKEGGRSAVEKLAKSVRHILLLTATPREARRARGAARARSTPFGWAVSVVDPKWPPPTDDGAAISADAALAANAALIAACDEAVARASAASQELRDAASKSAVDLGDLPRAEADDPRALARESTLMERVIRTRRRQLAEQPTTRMLVRVPIEYRDEEIALHERASATDGEERARTRRAACSSWAAVADRPSRSVKDALDPVRRARLDSKLEAFVDQLSTIWAANPGRKVVVRCEYKATADLVVDRVKGLLLEGALRDSSDAEVAAWRNPEQIGPVARLDQTQDTIIDALVNPATAGASMLAHLAAFERDTPGSAIVLVATDVAAIGLNLQFARDLVLYDLPWTPGLAEQWIGRLDRVGQRAADVRVYTLTHPGMACAPLLDVYEQIGLFTSATRVRPEADEEIERLVRRGDDDEIPWADVITRLQALLAREGGEEHEGQSLDLPPAAPPAEANSRAAVLGLFTAMAPAGFGVKVTGNEVEVTWPPTERDCVRLREVRGQLRSSERRARGRNPEEDAALRLEAKILRLSLVRSAAGLGRGANDLVTPRHPLVAELAHEVQSDPSLPLSAVRVRKRDVRPGFHLVTLLAPMPAAGGEAPAWLSRAAEVAHDDVLRREFHLISLGLRRAITTDLTFAPRTAAWRLERRGDQCTLREPLDPRTTSEIIASLPSGECVRPNEIAVNLDELLTELERPSQVHLVAALAVMNRVAAAFARHARLVGARLIAQRERRLASTGAGDSWRGARDAFARELEDAREFFGRLQRLPEHASAGAVEASTERVVCAALVEVFG